MVDQVDRRLALSGAATVVALAGATGSGKSSLFNALSGTDLATVGVRRPTTARRWPRPGADVARGRCWTGCRSRGGTRSPARAGDLDGLVLLDLPDHDSTEVAHRIEVDRLVQLVDVLVWVVDPQKYADAALHDRYLKPLAGHADVMIVVLNQVDRLTTVERDACLSDLRRLLEPRAWAGSRCSRCPPRPATGSTSCAAGWPGRWPTSRRPRAGWRPTSTRPHGPGGGVGDRRRRSGSTGTPWTG